MNKLKIKHWELVIDTSAKEVSYYIRFSFSRPKRTKKYLFIGNDPIQAFILFSERISSGKYLSKNESVCSRFDLDSLECLKFHETANQK